MKTMTVPKKLQGTLEFMYQELKKNKLRVCLVKAPEQNHPGHMIRVVENKNPWWYQELCRSYPDGRKENHLKKKPRTKLKRKAILKVLERMYIIGLSKSPYAKDILELAKEYEERFKEGNS